VVFNASSPHPFPPGGVKYQYPAPVSARPATE